MNIGEIILFLQDNEQFVLLPMIFVLLFIVVTLSYKQANRIESERKADVAHKQRMLEEIEELKDRIKSIQSPQKNKDDYNDYYSDKLYVVDADD